LYYIKKIDPFADISPLHRKKKQNFFPKNLKKISPSPKNSAQKKIKPARPSSARGHPVPAKAYRQSTAPPQKFFFTIITEAEKSGLP